ncbi:MAG TPA: glycosyltransferase [Caulobacteraceae bacterium]|nr:glycosyltransferase [Caulobacteraceae bacterium]
MPPRTATISIVIPTQRRTPGLARAARSVLRQTGVDHVARELVIADNDQVPSARPTAELLAAEAAFPVIYVHEPRSGVANARNAALGAARGALVAFLDDDQEAPAGWLAALLDVQARFDADAVFGPVQARVPAGVVEHRVYFEHFFSHLGPAEAGLKVGHTACGNSLVRRAALPDRHRPFSELRNQTGGEDDLLYGGMRAAGARFAWSPAACLFEDPLPERLSLNYTIARAFAYGHGPTVHCASSSPPDWLGVARWMAIGLTQALAFGLVAAGKWLVRAEDRALALDRAARGLGKVLWWGPFHIQFYGRTASQESSRPASHGLGGRKRNARVPV